jgi:catechol 2,3-dioxygenase-like lactoylglutathione lyase family enzyme
MTITRMFAQMTVTDLEAAQRWYTRLFDCEPHARPMPGLLEWHLSDTFGVQVWAEPERAGRSCVVLDESDLDTFVTHLDEVGITHQGPQDASFSRILPLLDPDGNRVVITGAFTPRG